MRTGPTPGRLDGRSGVLFLILPLLLAGCDLLPGRATIELDEGDVSIPGRIHEVHLGASEAPDSMVPAAVEASTDDAIRFVVDDRRPHAVTFVVEELSDEARAFLDRTGQLRGPPLVNRGSEWVVILEDAVPGRYPFRCRVHDVGGELSVTSDD